jgi:hypothetical protein
MSSRSSHKSKSLKSRSSTRTFKSSLETQDSVEPPMPTLDRSKSSFSIPEQSKLAEPAPEPSQPTTKSTPYTKEPPNAPKPSAAPTPDLWMSKPKPLIHQTNLPNHSSKRSTLTAGLSLHPPNPMIQPYDQRPLFVKHKSTPSKGHCIDCGVEVH